jgi:hypothetical protein
MVAVSAYFKYQQKQYKYNKYWQQIKVEPNLDL